MVQGAWSDLEALFATTIDMVQFQGFSLLVHGLYITGFKASFVCNKQNSKYDDSVRENFRNFLSRWQNGSMASREGHYVFHQFSTVFKILSPLVDVFIQTGTCMLYVISKLAFEWVSFLRREYLKHFQKSQMQAIKNDCIGGKNRPLSDLFTIVLLFLLSNSS